MDGSDGFSSAASGAAAGTAVMPGWGTVIGAGLGLLGSFMTNESNSANAARSTQAAWEMQEANQQFQERMSNSAHQREVKDLIAAGLNPMLSARLGGASTPSGSMGSPTTAKVENPALAAAASAQAFQQAGLVEANTEVARSQAILNSAQTAKVRSETLNTDMDTELKVAQRPNVVAMLPKIREETKNLVAQGDLYAAQTDKVIAEVKTLIPAQGKYYDASAASAAAEAVLRQLGYWPAKRESEFAEKTGLLSPAVGVVGKVANSAAAAANAVSRIRSMKR